MTSVEFSRKLAEELNKVLIGEEFDFTQLHNWANDLMDREKSSAYTELVGVAESVASLAILAEEG